MRNFSEKLKILLCHHMSRPLYQSGLCLLFPTDLRRWVRCLKTGVMSADSQMRDKLPFDVACIGKSVHYPDCLNFNVSHGVRVIQVQCSLSKTLKIQKYLPRNTVTAGLSSTSCVPSAIERYAVLEVPFLSSVVDYSGLRSLSST